MADNSIRAEIDLIFDKFYASLKKVPPAVKQMTDKVETESATGSKKIDGIWQAAMLQISIYAAQAARKIITAFKNTIGVFADFEQSLANTFSIVSDGSDQSEDDLLRLEAAARRVGATTRSTASEAANALYYLASAGFDAAEAVAALDGVNALAIATQSDLAKSSEFVATTIRQFGLRTDEATDIANTFTAAITSSLATLNKLTKAFEYVGPIAGGLGHTVEETTGALQVLFNQGFSGEKAGRALRRVLVDLADSSSVVNKRLARLGVTFDEVNPATNNLADIVRVLDENYVDASNAAAIFGKISGAQVAALIASGADEIERMTEAVTGTNRAFEAMDIQMDTLQGSIDKFKNAAEALSINIGKGLAPILRGVIDTATDFLKLLGKIPDGIAGAIAAFTSLAAVAATSAFGITKLAAVIGIAVPGFGTLFLGITAVVSGLVALIDAVQKSRSEMARRYEANFGEIAEDIGIAEEELESFYKVAARVRRDIVNLASFKPDIDTDTLKSKLHEIANEYGLTYEEVLKLAEANKYFTRIYEEQLAEIYLQQEAQQELTEYEQQRIRAGRVRQQQIINENKLQRELDAAASARAQTVAQIEGGLILAFEQAASKQVLLGNSYNRNSDLLSAYQSAIVSLIKEGYTPEAEEVKSLIALYEELQEQYGAVRGGETSDLQKRLTIQKNLTDELAKINEQRILANQYGLEYNAVQARSAAVQAALNELIGEGFTIQGAGIQAFLKEFGSYIVAQGDALSLVDEYTDKINALTKTEEELRELERQRLIELADGNEEAIDIINRYFEILGSRAAQDTFNEQADIAQEYREKLIQINETAIETIERERDLVLARVYGNKAATKAVNEYYDALISGLQATADAAEKDELFDTLDQALTAGSKALDLFDRAQREATQRFIDDEERKLQAQLARIDAGLAAELEAIDATETAALEAAGLREETEIERLERELAEAITAGDSITAAELADELERTRIKEQYANERAAAVKAAEEAEAEARLATEKAIAEAEYKAALNSWRIDLLKATAQASLAVAGAIAGSPLTFGQPWASINAGLAAAEVAVIAASKPEAPAFENGGIVPGSSTTGDNVLAKVNSGELILNKAQQQSVATQLQDTGRPIQINHSTYLDGRKVAENSAIYYNNGKVRILK